jgi:hypothetical protein
LRIARLLHACVAIATLVVVPNSFAGQETRVLQPSDAKLVAFAALNRELATSGLYAMPDDYSPGFYAYEILNFDGNVSAVGGHLAVNKKDGEVWDLGGYCTRKISQKVKETQRSIRKRLGITNEIVAQQYNLKPLCDAKF